MRSFFADESCPLRNCNIITLNKAVTKVKLSNRMDYSGNLPGGLLDLTTTATTSATGSIPTRFALKFKLKKSGYSEETSDQDHVKGSSVTSSLLALPKSSWVIKRRQEPDAWSGQVPWNDYESPKFQLNEFFTGVGFKTLRYITTTVWTHKLLHDQFAEAQQPLSELDKCHHFRESIKSLPHIHHAIDSYMVTYPLVGQQLYHELTM